MLEQMVKTKVCRETRGLSECNKSGCVLNIKHLLEHLLAGCKVLGNSEYLARHNRALMILAVAWAKEYNLVDKDVKWYKEKWLRGHILENAQAKLIWDFEFNLQKITIYLLFI